MHLLVGCCCCCCCCWWCCRRQNLSLIKGFFHQWLQYQQIQYVLLFVAIHVIVVETSIPIFKPSMEAYSSLRDPNSFSRQFQWMPVYLWNQWHFHLKTAFLLGGSTMAHPEFQNGLPSTRSPCQTNITTKNSYTLPGYQDPKAFKIGQEKPNLLTYPVCEACILSKLYLKYWVKERRMLYLKWSYLSHLCHL